MTSAAVTTQNALCRQIPDDEIHQSNETQDMLPRHNLSAVDITFVLDDGKWLIESNACPFSRPQIYGSLRPGRIWRKEN